MKYLRLDARHPECHGLAMALVGSPTDYQWQLLGAFDSALMVVDLGDHGLRLDAEWVEVVRLPLATLKLCPYVAMREGVVFKYELGFCVDRAPMFSKTDLFSDIAKLSWTIKGLEQVALDLDNLPKGAEIVEHEP